MGIEDTKIEVGKEFEYVFGARAYFLLSYFGTQKVEERITTGKFTNPFGEIVPDWVFLNNYLLLPVIYNLKHGIELAIKGLFQLMGEDFEEKHDLKTLFKRLKQNKKINSNHSAGLEGLVTKYHGNELLIDKIKNNFVMEDIKNDVFRYPDNKAKIILKFFHVLPEFSLVDLKQMRADIIELDNKFYEIGISLLGPPPTLEEIEAFTKEFKK